VNAGPDGAIAAAATFAAYAISRHYDDLAVSRTTATITLMIVGLWVLILLARPITPGRALIVGAMVASFGVVLAVPALRDWFALELPSGPSLSAALGCSAAGIVALEIGWELQQRRLPADRRTPRWGWRGDAGLASQPVA
jgi:cation-transporting ATPase E